MDLKTNIIEVTEKNIKEHPQVICFINPKHEFYNKKIDWLKDQFKLGLKIKLLYLEGEKKPIGFIEYITGEYCFRAVSAKGYMFINCIWINGNKYKKKGLGSLLLKEVEKDAKRMLGVCLITSDKSFMAGKSLFVKNGYKVLSVSGDEQLLVKEFKSGKLPKINDWENELKKYKGLTILYSKQCPWVARFIEEVKPILKQKKLSPKIIELKTYEEAQIAPSVYGCLNIIYNGKLLADRYVSVTRFLNIVKQFIRP